jgi:hypothetical protein
MHAWTCIAQVRARDLAAENERLRRDNERFVRLIDSGEWGRWACGWAGWEGVTIGCGGHPYGIVHVYGMLESQAGPTPARTARRPLRAQGQQAAK